MVFYRRYRPGVIAELDSVSVSQTLLSVFSQKEIPHAFLFTGPKGLGKTSTARIVAKAVNCEKKLKEFAPISKKGKEEKSSDNHSSKVEPCNQCEQCVSITNGTNLDVLEIDGASNRGIDEIRELREKIRLAPVAARKKVYIIDEVHMLTTEAFNALLKTLEEPPDHALFILCTTELHKVPQTIISRCFHLVFPRATIEDLIHSFRRIVKGEELDIEEDALLLIASLSDGGFRDGAKLLEEVSLRANGKKITRQFVETTIRSGNVFGFIEQILDCFAKKEVKAGLVLISTMQEQGIDMKFVLEQLVHRVHMLLLALYGVGETTRTEGKALFTQEELVRLSELFSKAYGQMRFAVVDVLPLELALLEWSKTEDQKVSPLIIKEESKKETKVKSEITSSSPLQSSFDSVWKLVVEKVKEKSHIVAGLLRGCTLKEYNTERFVIETSFSFHKEKLEEQKTKELLAESIYSVCENNPQIEIVLK